MLNAEFVEGAAAGGSFAAISAAAPGTAMVAASLTSDSRLLPIETLRLLSIVVRGLGWPCGRRAWRSTADALQRTEANQAKNVPMLAALQRGIMAASDASRSTHLHLTSGLLTGHLRDDGSDDHCT